MGNRSSQEFQLLDTFEKRSFDSNVLYMTSGMEYVYNKEYKSNKDPCNFIG